MDKQELLAQLNSNFWTDAERQNLVLIGSSALVLLGVVKECSYIDCCLPTIEEVEAVAKRHNKALSPILRKLFLYKGVVELSTTPDVWSKVKEQVAEDNRIVKIHGFNCWSPSSLLVVYLDIKDSLKRLKEIPTIAS